MLETLRAWLNGAREYYTGVSLYRQLEGENALFKVLAKGATDYTKKRLQEELMAICLQLKASDEQGNAQNSQQPAAVFHAEKTPKQPTAATTAKSIAPPQKNLPLYEACKLVADKKYKEVMNQRAVLFSLAKVDDYADPNTPENINARAKLALEVAVGFQEASRLYDNADYVKEHGRLPDTDDETENEYDHLADSLVKQTLDNLRKNYNKMKKREATPERVALMQKHEANIKKLEVRWHSLKA